MGANAAKRSALTVRATSPDANIQARSLGGVWRELGFRPGSFAGYRDSTLAWQLGAVASMLATGHERGVAKLADLAGRNRRTDLGNAKNAAQRDYLAAVRSLRAQADGPAGLVRFVTNGPLRWKCEILPGPAAYCGEAEFVLEVLAAARATAADFRTRMFLLKSDHYDLGGPRRRSTAKA